MCVLEPHLEGIVVHLLSLLVGLVGHQPGLEQILIEAVAEAAHGHVICNEDEQRHMNQAGLGRARFFCPADSRRRLIHMHESLTRSGTSVWEEQRLNVSCDHPEVRRWEDGDGRGGFVSSQSICLLFYDFSIKRSSRRLKESLSDKLKPSNNTFISQNKKLRSQLSA